MPKPNSQVITATADDIIRFYGIEFHTPFVVKAIRKGELVAGLGGVLEIEPGVWFAFLEVPSHERRPFVYRHILSTFRAAKERGATVFKAHCTDGIPRAKELMERLGFVETDEVMGGKRVWALNVGL